MYRLLLSDSRVDVSLAAGGLLVGSLYNSPHFETKISPVGYYNGSPCPY